MSQVAIQEISQQNDVIAEAADELLPRSAADGEPVCCDHFFLAQQLQQSNRKDGFGRPAPGRRRDAPGKLWRPHQQPLDQGAAKGLRTAHPRDFSPLVVRGLEKLEYLAIDAKRVRSEVVHYDG